MFILGGLVLISNSVAERAASHHSYSEYKSLNTTVLEDIWTQRRNHAGLRVLGDFIFCLAYLLMLPAVLILADGITAGANQSSGTRLLLPCFGIVSFTIMLSFLSSAGTLSVADWVSTFEPFDPKIATTHLHDGGWGPYQSLEVSYRVQTGQGLWLIVFDELALSIFFMLVGWYTMKAEPLKRVIHRCHPWLSMALGVLMHLSFWFGLLRLVNWGIFMILGAIVGVVTNLILVPIWLISLGRHLHVLQVAGMNDGLLNNQFQGGSEMSPTTMHTSDGQTGVPDDLGDRI
jgi:hypothetical protein